MIVWAGENQPFKIEDMASGIGTSYATTRRYLMQLVQEGKIELVNEFQVRNAFYQLTGASSKMPHYKPAGESKLQPLSWFFEEFMKATRKSDKQLTAVNSQIYQGIAWLFAAAYYANRGSRDPQYNKSRQSLTFARRKLIIAQKQLEDLLKLNRQLLEDKRLSPDKPEALINLLLNDEKYPIDFTDLANDIERFTKMYGVGE